MLIILKFTLKGFVCSLLDLTKAILSLALAFLLRIPVANLFNDLFMENAMVSVVKKSLEAYLENDFTRIYIDVENLPDPVINFLTHFNLDKDNFNANFPLVFGEEKDFGAIESLAENIGGAIATLLSTILAFIAVTIVAYIVLSIVFALISHLRKFDGVKTADRLLGIALGVMIAITVLWGCTQGILFAGRFLPNYVNEDTIGSSMVVSIFKNLNLVDFVMNRFYS